MKDVIIVGGGPVGLLTAIGLGRAGIDVTVLESEAAVVDSPRAMVYHWAVLSGLERLGVLDGMLDLGFQKNDYRYLAVKTGEQISWTIDVLKGRVRHPYNVHLGQNRLAEIATRVLRDIGNVEVKYNARVTGVLPSSDGVIVRASTASGDQELAAGWVVAADGARSVVRGALGIGFDGMTWPKRFVATNIRADLEALGYARSVLMLDGEYGAILAKIDRTNLWRCTYCEDPALAEEGVADRMPGTFARILPAMKNYELASFSPYRMHQRTAGTYRQGRVLLAGDAAHSTNPTGGLGLTSGLFDVFVLYEALAAVIRGEAGEEILDRYAAERKRVFDEIASPQASENNRLVYDSADPVRLEEDLKKLRRLATDESFRLERSLFARNLETPSLLTGHRSNDITPA